MTREECAQALKHILPFFKCAGDELKDYIREVYSQFQHLDAKRFEVVCRALAERMVPYKRPVPSEYREVYRRCADTFRWNDSTARPQTAGEKHAHFVQMAADLSPSAARFILASIESGRVSFPEDILKIIIERAGADADPPAQTVAEPAILGHIEILKGRRPDTMKSFGPAVADVPEERRRELDAQAEEQEIPF
mgnify:FL=1